MNLRPQRSKRFWRSEWRLNETVVVLENKKTAGSPSELINYSRCLRCHVWLLPVTWLPTVCPACRENCLEAQALGWVLVSLAGGKRGFLPQKTRKPDLKMILKPIVSYINCPAGQYSPAATKDMPQERERVEDRVIGCRTRTQSQEEFHASKSIYSLALPHQVWKDEEKLQICRCISFNSCCWPQIGDWLHRVRCVGETKLHLLYIVHRTRQQIDVGLKAIEVRQQTNERQGRSLRT